jgi:hypothetical protein
MAVLLLASGIGMACKTKGNGIGTAPPNFPCPLVRPEAASPCPDKEHVGSEANVCPFAGTCADPNATGEAFFFCPGGTNAAWKCIDGTDAGPTDASSDATDGETSTDDADAGETDADATDETDTSDAELDAADAPATETDLDAGDAALDTSLDVALDVDALTD